MYLRSMIHSMVELVRKIAPYEKRETYLYEGLE